MHMVADYADLSFSLIVGDAIRILPRTHTLLFSNLLILKFFAPLTR